MKKTIKKVVKKLLYRIIVEVVIEEKEKRDKYNSKAPFIKMHDFPA